MKKNDLTHRLLAFIQFLMGAMVFIWAMFAWTPQGYAQCGACDPGGLYTVTYDAAGGANYCIGPVVLTRTAANPECCADENCVVLKITNLDPGWKHLFMEFSGGLGTGAVYDKDCNLLASGVEELGQFDNPDGDTEVCVTFCKPGSNNINVDLVCVSDGNADLEVVSVTNTTSPLVPGTTEQFNIVVRNNSLVPAVGAIANFDIVDVNWYLDDATSPYPWTFLLSGVAMRTTPMPAGATETLTVWARIPSDASHTTGQNPPMGPAWASISHAGEDADPANNQNLTAIISRVEAGLTIEKKTLTPNVAPGGTALFEMNICNTGPSDAAGVGVTDTPGANLVAGSVVLSPGANNLYIPAGECRTVLATATVDPAAVIGAIFSNTAAIDITNFDDGIGASDPPVVTVGTASTSTGTVVGGGALAPVDIEVVSLSLVGGGPLVPGTTRTFNITARNNGPTDAYGVVLTTLLFDVAYIRNNSSTPGGWGVAGSGGTWVRLTSWPSGQTDNFSLEVIIPSDAHYTAGLPIDDFRAHIGGANPDPNTANNSQIIFFDCQAQANLSIQKTLFTGEVSPGGTALWEVTVCNSGPSDIDGIGINDVPGLNLNGATLVLSADESDLYIPAGQCVDVLVSVQVNAGAIPGASFCNSASVDLTNLKWGFGSTLAPIVNAPATQDVCGTVGNALGNADLEAVSVQLTTGPLVPGTSETFTFTVRNNGPSPAYGATVVFNLLDTDWSIDNDSSPAGWSFFGNGAYIRTTAMPSGATESFSLTLKIPSNAAYNANDLIGPYSITVAASNPDPNIANNTINSFDITSQVQATLTIEKVLFTPGVAPGGTSLWEVSICNTGPSDVQDVELDDLPGLNLVAGSLVLSGDADDLYIPAGQCVDVLVSAQVSPAAVVGASFCNSATADASSVNLGGTSLPPIVNSPATGDVCGAVINALPDADLEVVSLAHSTSPLIPGTTETFDFTVRNNGPSPAYGVVVLVDLVDCNWIVNNYFFPPNWTYFGDGVFARMNPMPAGAEESFSLFLDIPADAYIEALPDNIGPIYVSIASSSPDPITFNNTQVLPLITENHAELSIVKSLINSEIKPGETAIYHIVVNNAGPSDVDQVGIVDVLIGDAGFLYFEPFNINNFYVAANQSKSYLVTAIVNDDGCGVVENCAYVFGPAYNIDEEPDNNGPSCVSFTIVDDVQPVATVCPADITVNNDPGLCGAVVNCTVEFTDNCDEDLTIEVIDGIGCGGFFPVGTTEVGYKATDDAGNTEFCYFDVTVIDNEQPTIVCPEDIVIDINANGEATVAEGFANIYAQGPCGVTLTYEPPVADDNCDWIMTNYAGLGAIDNFSVQGFASYFAPGNWDISADGDGYVYTGVAPLSVQLFGADDGTPNAQTRMCITFPVDGTMSFDWYYETFDIDGPAFDPFGYELDGVFYQLSDNLGANVQNGTVTINVESGQEFCFVQSTTDGVYGVGTTVTNLFVFEDENTPNPQYYEYGGVYTEGWQVIDASGNQEICNFTITIHDTQAPVIRCPNNIVVETDPGICGAAVMYAYPLGLENCPDWYMIQLQGPAPGQIFPIGNTTVEYQITDNAGNFTTCLFQVRVVDGEAPTFFECAPDQDVLTSSNGLGDCSGDIPRLTDDVVVGDNCADTDLPPVALFYDPDYVDTQENCDGEAYNVLQHLINRGFPVVIIDRLDDYDQWSDALGVANILILPTMEGNGDFLADMPANVEALLYSFVDANGGKLLVMGGGSGPNNAATTINHLYGFGLVQNCCFNGNISYLNLVNSLYTAFQNGPVSIQHHFSTLTVDNVPFLGKKIYEMSTDGKPTVAWMPKGNNGEIIYFGWTFRNGGPLCADADTEFTEVLDRALLELAGEGIIITQSPEEGWDWAGQHGDQIEVVISAIDFSGNESSCTATLTLIDDENPTIMCDGVDTELESSPGLCAYVVENDDLDPEFDDNCHAVMKHDYLPAPHLWTLEGAVLPVGETTVTWTVTDDAGNFVFCVVTYTVVDVENPYFTLCPEDIMVGVDPDECGAYVNWQGPVAEDNCAAVVVQTGGLPTGSFFPTGPSVIEYTATDEAGNSAICTFTVTVVETQNPVAICQDVVIYLDENGLASITVDDVDGGSYDNCGEISLTLNMTDFSCLDVGENNVVLTVTDPSGNSEICVAEVTVVDNLIPTFTCPDPATVSGCDELVPDLVSLITDADDNCGVASITQNPVAGTDFGNQSGQSIIVTIYVVDVNGNVATCEVLVTIDDTVPPYFVNCPTEMHMIGNDPDQCSGKLNWSIPVALDNCGVESIVQVSGPTVGSIIPVCQPMTVVYVATDAVGNSSECSFEVMVVDTQNPEFDADIVMPGDITVECDAVPAPFVLTNNDVHDNCTAPADLIIEFTETSTQDPNELVCEHYNYTITRTWTVTDETCIFGGGGNQLIHVQIITVEDTTPPVALCQNITVVLDLCGMATITPDMVNNGSYDNCAPAYALTYTVFPNTFDCSNLGENEVTLTVTDPCGNSATCIAIVTVVEGIAPCEPQPSVETHCLNNATVDQNNGQFAELITIKNICDLTWTIISSTGLYTNSSPAPPAAPVPVANGTVFTVGTADGIDNDNDGFTDEFDEQIYYTFIGKFVECVGYTATLQSNLGDVVTISNKACYPTPVFVDLYDPFCLSTPPFPIQVVDFYGADGEIIFVSIDGVPLDPPFIFDPVALGQGPHLIVVVFDAFEQQNYTIINGVVVDGSPQEILTNSGCQQPISAWVNVVETPVTVACNDTIQVSLEGDCVSEVTPDMILEGTYFCYDDYTVTITYPYPTNTYNPPNQVDASHIGYVLVVNLSHIISGNMCWGYIVVEDKWQPEITCPDDIEILCVYDEDDLLITGEPVIFDCSDYVVEYSDEYIQYDCSENSEIFTHITRTWIVTDEWGNQSTCVQIIDQLRGELDQVTWPADVTYNCNEVPANFNPPITGWPEIDGIDLTTAGTGICGLSVSYSDVIANICPGDYKIVRTWTIIDWCTAETGEITTSSYTQYIHVKDVPPSIQFVGQAWEYDPFNDWYIISANNWVTEPHPSCYALGPLPLAIIDGVCNEIVSIEVNTEVGTTTNGGILPWPGLDIGPHEITYVAEDECGNITSVTITVNVIDNIAPIAICDEITDANLSGDGLAVVFANTFDDGSYDNCCLDYFEARRMDGDCDGNYDDFGPTVTFCCVDAGQAITVIFRAYDCYGNFNDCMVTVNVNDKLPPIIISCPATTTITCDEYLDNYAAGIAGGNYSVLDGFGEPIFYDNCELNIDYTVTVNIDNCAQGTITRQWVATDAGTVPVTCTQTIFVEHVSDWVVEFPQHVTVVCTDGQLPDTGEPEIFFDECELIAVSYEDQVFTVVPDACYKIERTWSVINWCVYEQFGEDLYSELGHAESNLFVDWDGDGDQDNRTFRDGYNSSGNPGIADGFIVWKQIIKVIDEEAPVFEIPPIDGCIVESDCDKDLTLPYPIITDECSLEYDVDITGDFGFFNDISGDVIVPNVGVGEYDVQYAVTDNCGNTAYQSVVVVVEDCKLPIPICKNGLVVEIDPPGAVLQVDVYAWMIDEFSWDNCGEPLQFSWSPDVTDTVVTYTCDDLGQIPVTMWVTDIYGNQDYCETFIILQDNLDLCGGGNPIVIAGAVETEEVEPVEGVTVEMNGGLLTQVTGPDGLYEFNIVAGNDYSVTPTLDENAANGVTTYDMVLITRHILVLQMLDTPYKIIAADANKSGSVTTLDLVAIRKVILQVESSFPNNTSWRFVDQDYVFPNPANPFAEQFPEVISYNNMQISDLEADFVAIKVGDVNSSAVTNLSGSSEDRTMMGDLILHTKDLELKAGETYQVTFNGDDQEVFGYQFTMELGEGIELVEVQEGVASEENFGFALLEDGALTTSWNEAEPRRLGSDEALFTLVLKAKANTTLSKALSISSRYTTAEAYNANGELLNVQLAFGNEVAAGFELYQNVPNPFTGETRIGFRLPEPTTATLTIMEASGKTLKVVKGDYSAGYNEFSLSDFGQASGVLYYRLDTPTHTATRIMVIME